MVPVSKTPGSKVSPVVHPTILKIIHQPGQCNSPRRITHWAIPVVNPITNPSTFSNCWGIPKKIIRYPMVHPMNVATTQRQDLSIRRCRTNHWKIPTNSPEVIMGRPEASPPKNQPRVVAIIQKNNRDQSIKRISQIKNLILAFHRSGQQTTDEVALKQEEDKQWNDYA